MYTCTKTGSFLWFVDRMHAFYLYRNRYPYFHYMDKSSVTSWRVSTFLNPLLKLVQASSGEAEKEDRYFWLGQAEWENYFIIDDLS